MLAKYNISKSYKQTYTWSMVYGVVDSSVEAGVDLVLNLYSGGGVTRLKGYEEYLKTITNSDDLSVTLLTKGDLKELGCNSTCGKSWLKLTKQSYWLRTTGHKSKWNFYYVTERGQIALNYDTAGHGIRPLVIVSKDIISNYQ